ncbi:mitochondrial ribosomal protein S25-domain-containing protein [Amylocystis lapponica]|nr:mitochondrial ribosomal protein S25-domain-containing protein [Amylocystis lapponica]
MSRRIASQVHKQTSRLLRENYLKKEPAWYQAVLDHPPLPLPPKAPPSRSEFDLPRAVSSRAASSARARPAKTRPLPIHYVEDEVRRQFFDDHPFEAFRATSLIEGAAIEDEHPIRGEQWTRLKQRGRNPTAEDAVRYAVNLHLHHNMALTYAYASAVAQFRALRSEHQVARSIARLEADWYGTQFGPSQVEITFQKEEKAFDTWQTRDEVGENAARKRWKVIVERDGSQGGWTRGQEYVRLWQEGVRPSYAPLLKVESKITPAGLTGLAGMASGERERISADFIHVLQ